MSSSLFGRANLHSYILCFFLFVCASSIISCTGGGKKKRGKEGNGMVYYRLGNGGVSLEYTVGTLDISSHFADMLVEGSARPTPLGSVTSKKKPTAGGESASSSSGAGEEENLDVAVRTSK
jgi:hypothetical protein